MLQKRQGGVATTNVSCIPQPRQRQINMGSAQGKTQKNKAMKPRLRKVAILTAYEQSSKVL